MSPSTTRISVWAVIICIFIAWFTSYLPLKQFAIDVLIGVFILLTIISVLELIYILRK